MLKQLRALMPKKISSYELILKNDPFTLADDVTYSRKSYFTYSDLKDELMDYKESKSLVYSTYHMICKNSDSLFFESLNLKPSLFMIKSGFLGREFNKTSSMRVSYKGDLKPVIFEVLSGEGYFVIERDKSVEIDLVRVKKGDYVLIEKECSFVMINSGENNLICLSLIGKNTVFENTVLKNNAGAKLFLTKSGFVKNMNVSSVFHLNEFEGDHIGDFSFDKEKGLYRECIYLPEKFKFLLE